MSANAGDNNGAMIYSNNGNIAPCIKVFEKAVIYDVNEITGGVGGMGAVLIKKVIE